MKQKRGRKKPSVPKVVVEANKATSKEKGEDGPASSSRGGIPDRDLRKNLGC